MGDKKTAVEIKKEKQRSYNILLLWQRIKHGLFLLTLRNVLMRFGLDIEPYWIELESPEFCQEPGIKANVGSFELKIIDNDILSRQFQLLGWKSGLLKNIRESDHLSLALYHGEEIASFMIATLGEYNAKGRIVPLSENEAYLEYMYTYEDFRGKNLAPYMRYKSYILLNEKGISTFYSGSQYFNKSSLKFKKKLGAKHLEFWLHVGLFKKFKWNFLLKTYENQNLT